MNDVERRALELLNEVRDEGGSTHEALCRAIEAHDAFRQEVSEAISDLLSMAGDQLPYGSKNTLSRFIIQPKTDPLVEALKELDGTPDPEWSYADDAAKLRAALAKRGLEIREVGE